MTEKTPKSGTSLPNWIIAFALVIIVAGGAYVFFNGGLPNDEDNVEIKIEIPKLD